MLARFFGWFRKNRCRHHYFAIGHVAVDKWHPVTLTNYFYAPPRHGEGAVREVRVTLRCGHCGRVMLAQARETQMAGCGPSIEIAPQSLEIILGNP